MANRGEDTRGKVRTHLWLDPALIEEIKEFQHARRLASRNEAARELLRFALDRAPRTPPEEGR